MLNMAKVLKKKTVECMPEYFCAKYAPSGFVQVLESFF